MNTFSIKRITRCATADKFCGKMSSKSCFVGSYTPMNSADALLVIVVNSVSKGFESRLVTQK